MSSNAGWPLCPEGKKASTAFRMLTRRLRSHIEDNAPLTKADLDQAAADPSALAFVCIRIGVLHGLKASKSRWGQHVEDWPAAFARADALAREIVIRQTRLLVYAQHLITGGSYGRVEEAEVEEGQPKVEPEAEVIERDR